MDRERHPHSGGKNRNFGTIPRRHDRRQVSGIIGNIADNKKAVEGLVSDISEGGFKCTGLPLSFSAEDFTLKAVLSGGGKHYKLLVKPCWQRKTGAKTADIGFKIIDGPWEWLEFAMMQLDGLREN